jgi:hypothetical protein
MKTVLIIVLGAITLLSVSSLVLGGEEEGERCGWLKHRADVPPVRNEQFARGEACHQGAEPGSFDEQRVRIPGYGRWDD